MHSAYTSKFLIIYRTNCILIQHVFSFLFCLLDSNTCRSWCEIGFSTTRGHAISRLNSQLSFTRQKQLSKISEETENVVNGLSRESEPKKSSHSYATTSYGVGSWEDVNSLMFSVGPNKRAKNISSDIVNGLNSMETQVPKNQFQLLTLDRLFLYSKSSLMSVLNKKCIQFSESRTIDPSLSFFI